MGIHLTALLTLAEIALIASIFGTELKEGIFNYKDKDMRFIKMALKQLPFFEHLGDTDTIFYDIIYSIDTNKKNQGEILI